MTTIMRVAKIGLPIIKRVIAKIAEKKRPSMEKKRVM
jgi:hypothetical protein